MPTHTPQVETQQVEPQKHRQALRSNAAINLLGQLRLSQLYCLMSAPTSILANLIGMYVIGGHPQDKAQATCLDAAYCQH